MRKGNLKNKNTAMSNNIGKKNAQYDIYTDLIRRKLILLLKTTILKMN